MGQVTIILDDAAEAELRHAAAEAGVSHHKWLVDLVRCHLRRRCAAAERAAVLIAEDDPIFRELLRCQVEVLGWRADAAENGAEAMSLLAEGSYRLLLTDWRMPVMDGGQLVRAIRAGERRRATPRLPVVAVSGEDLLAGNNGRRELGIDGYLPKPLDAQALAEALACWLGAAPGERRGDGPARLPGASDPLTAPAVAGSRPG